MDTTVANPPQSARAPSQRVRLADLLPDVRELRTLVREVTDLVDHLIDERQAAH